MVEAASLGQLSTVRKLLDGGTATVEDQDEVKFFISFSLLPKPDAYHKHSTQHTTVQCIEVTRKLVTVIVGYR